MLDIATLLKGSLTTNWGLTAPNPTAPSIALDEFDPKFPMFQILLELVSGPKNHIVDGVYYVQETCKVTIFLKPKAFDPTTVTALRSQMLAIQTEVDRIVETYTLTGVVHQLVSGWTKIVIDTGRGNRKGMFKCEENIVCQYYI